MKDSDAMLYIDGNIFIKHGTTHTGLQQLLKVKWFGPKTYIPNAWWKRKLVSHTTKVTMLQILHMWMLWTTEKEGSSLLAERTLETKRNSCLYWELFTFLHEFLGFNAEDINFLTSLMPEVTSSLTWLSKNWPKEQWGRLTIWLHIVTHCSLRLHTITKGK